MTISGKSINLFLLDGTAKGRIKCTLANWTGLVYKIPRTDLDSCKDRGDLRQSCVYFLFGISEQSGDNLVYIGQAGSRKNGEGILYRLQEHRRNPDKDFWNESVIFTTSNNSFGATEISYLENRFCRLASETGRYIVKNSNDPTPGHIMEEKESELEEFINNARIVMGTLGYPIFEPFLGKSTSVDNTPDTDKEMLPFYLKTTKANAIGYQTREGFVICKGSQLASQPTQSCPEIIKRLRERQSAHIDLQNILIEDILLPSPSAAAGFVTFASANGLTMWATEDGRTFKELESVNSP